MARRSRWQIYARSGRRRKYRGKIRRNLRTTYGRTRKPRAPRRRSRVPAIRRMKRNGNRARFSNRGTLALQSRLQGGGSLPMETHARFYWKGSGTIDFRGAPDGSSQQDQDDQNRDQALSLVNVHLPILNSTNTGTGFDLTNFVGDFSYKDIWKLLYSECLVLGSRMRYVIRRPLYPQNLSLIEPRSRVTTQHNRSVPSNASAGFWYMRYYYFRADHNDGTGSHYDQVGYPTSDDDSTLWANMRDFMADASVTWQRDKLPKMTKLSNTVYSNPNAPNHQTSDENANPIYDTSGDATRTTQRMYSESNRPSNINPPISQTYELEFSNRPIYFTAKYSLRKHRRSRDVNRTGFWQDLSDTSSGHVPVHDDFRVKFGYIAFNSNGTTAFTVPLDRHSQRHIEAEIQYFVRLRTPRVTPWNPITEIELSAARAVPEEDVEEELDNLEEEDEEEDVLPAL